MESFRTAVFHYARDNHASLYNRCPPELEKCFTTLNAGFKNSCFHLPRFYRKVKSLPVCSSFFKSSLNLDRSSVHDIEAHSSTLRARPVANIDLCRAIIPEQRNPTKPSAPISKLGSLSNIEIDQNAISNSPLLHPQVLLELWEKQNPSKLFDASLEPDILITEEAFSALLGITSHRATSSLSPPPEFRRFSISTTFSTSTKKPLVVMTLLSPSSHRYVLQNCFGRVLERFIVSNILLSDPPKNHGESSRVKDDDEEKSEFEQEEELFIDESFLQDQDDDVESGTDEEKADGGEPEETFAPQSPSHNDFFSISSSSSSRPSPRPSTPSHAAELILSSPLPSHLHEHGCSVDCSKVSPDDQPSSSSPPPFSSPSSSSFSVCELDKKKSGIPPQTISFVDLHPNMNSDDYTNKSNKNNIEHNKEKSQKKADAEPKSCQDDIIFRRTSLSSGDIDLSIVIASSPASIFKDPVTGKSFRISTHAECLQSIGLEQLSVEEYFSVWLSSSILEVDHVIGRVDSKSGHLALLELSRVTPSASFLSTPLNGAALILDALLQLNEGLYSALYDMPSSSLELWQALLDFSIMPPSREALLDLHTEVFFPRHRFRSGDEGPEEGFLPIARTWRQSEFLLPLTFVPSIDHFTFCKAAPNKCSNPSCNMIHLTRAERLLFRLPAGSGRPAPKRDLANPNNKSRGNYHNNNIKKNTQKRGKDKKPSGPPRLRKKGTESSSLPPKPSSS